MFHFPWVQCSPLRTWCSALPARTVWVELVPAGHGAGQLPGLQVSEADAAGHLARRLQGGEASVRKGGLLVGAHGDDGAQRELRER